MADDLSWLREDLRAIREGQSDMNAQMSAFHERADAHADMLREHDNDIKVLTAGHNELKGIAKGIRWLWAIIAAIAAFFGIHIATGK